jgi:hypothetical protein
MAGKPKQREKLRFGNTRQEAQNDRRMRTKITASLPLLEKMNAWKTKITARSTKQRPRPKMMRKKNLRATWADATKIQDGEHPDLDMTQKE